MPRRRKLDPDEEIDPDELQEKVEEEAPSTAAGF